ncbi:MAG: thiamine pyrophosphate-dependent dehydrogenase E1 component subunit alpha [Pseudomonadota bacterium]|nr:thiamine pyrophosphate-dependent dehydrogenase E1 component subunit alpha [Pseudomonadota bacterium]
MTQVLDTDRLLNHHLMMCRIRAFEEAALQANTENLVLGAIHPSIGQEAVASGICLNLQAEDLLTSTHRGHGHTLAKGADPRAMMRELLGREGGNSHGKGGSMHIADFRVGMLGANGVVGANIHIAAGAAHAIKMLKENRIVCSIFGDGAINRGPFLEGLNWAVVFHLPVLFVCEDNGFASTTRTSAVTGGKGPAARAEALGVATTTVDGNDLIEVDRIARMVMPSIRQGKGPQMIVARTYRLAGHTAADPDLYRPRDEVERAWRKDPIVKLGNDLRQADVDQVILEKHEVDAGQEMAEVFAEAKAAPWPSLSRAFEDVQDTGDPRQEAF